MNEDTRREQKGSHGRRSGAKRRTKKGSQGIRQDEQGQSERHSEEGRESKEESAEQVVYALAKYFFLRPHGIDQYAKASRAAMRQYAKLIQEENAQLAADLRDWANREEWSAIEETGGFRDDG